MSVLKEITVPKVPQILFLVLLDHIVTPRVEKTLMIVRHASRALFVHPRRL